ncbi:MAG: UvrB/UvrC motif-containing protein [Phycisphaerales bacterium]
MHDTLDIIVDLEDAGDVATHVDALPARPGVIAFEAPAGATILLAATGDLRRFARSRLGLDPDAPPTRANLRGVTARLAATLVGASFEGDVVYLREARRRLPKTYRAQLDTRRAWCVHLDPESPTPTWRKFDAASAGAERLPLRTVLGPIADKDAAGRFGEALDDAFDLCRYPKELERAPHGQACAYKEMGRCGGACDGSETMEAYRARAREACGFVSRPVKLSVSALEAEMARAAEGQDFELAASLRDRVGRAKKLDKVAMRWARRLDRLAILAVQPSPRRGWARLFRCDATGIAPIADASGKIDEGGAGALLRSIIAAGAPGGGERLTLEYGESLGLLANHLYHPRRGSGRLVNLDPPPSAGELRRHIRAAARVRRDETGGADDTTEREIGA